jgi:hypothetical protein
VKPIAKAFSPLNEQLKLRRLEQDRRALCQALGIVDDDSADIPWVVTEVGP